MSYCKPCPKIANFYFIWFPHVSVRFVYSRFYFTFSADVILHLTMVHYGSNWTLLLWSRARASSSATTKGWTVQIQDGNACQLKSICSLCLLPYMSWANSLLRPNIGNKALLEVGKTRNIDRKHVSTTVFSSLPKPFYHAWEVVYLIKSAVQHQYRTMNYSNFIT